MSTSKYIIHLHGIKRDDYIDVEDVFDQRIIECAELPPVEETVETVYKTIPPIFTCLDSWLLDTNIKCWHCDFTFTNRPVFIPIHIQEDSMIVHGNFCSFSCSSAYVTSFMSGKYMSNLLYLYKIFTGNNVLFIQPSPSRHITKKYGGYLDEDKYLLQIHLLESNICTNDEIYNKEYNEHPDDIFENISEGIKAWDLSNQPIINQ